MKGLALAVLISVAAILSCQGETNLLSINVWDRDESATASTDTPDFPRLSVAAETLGAPSQVSPLIAPVEDLFKKNYWYLGLLDVKEVFTAPARWDTETGWCSVASLASAPWLRSMKTSNGRSNAIGTQP